MAEHTPGPWFLSGVRFKMNGGEWHNVNRYNEALKRDENIACVGFDPRTGAGLTDARLISAAPELLADLSRMVEHFGTWANDHADEATCETWAALHCARETIRKAST